jgi:hypothetical protein
MMLRAIRGWLPADVVAPAGARLARMRGGPGDDDDDDDEVPIGDPPDDDEDGDWDDEDDDDEEEPLQAASIAAQHRHCRDIPAQ